jgi:hypothetical protein
VIARRILGPLVLMAVASPALAQPKERIGLFVADARGASVGLPAAVGWTPAVPSSTVVPSRGFGIDLGAHVYVLRMRRAAIGVGAAWITSASTTTPPEASTGTGTTPTPATIPDVTTRLTTLAPQVSLNFGHSLGWSYLSAGLGRAKVTSEATLEPGTTTFSPVNTGWVKSLNWGGGARWFINDHVGIGFDLRWHKLNPLPATNTNVAGSRVTLLVAGAGVVLK